MNGYLDSDELRQVREAAIAAGYGAGDIRPFLFEGILPAYEAVLPRYAAPGLQVQSDLSRLNSVERLIDGSVPLEQWLRNAAGQTSVAAPRGVFQAALDRVAAVAAGEPDIAVDAEELAEEIVFRDDMLPFSFLGAGLRAGSAVARLTVQPYDRGQVMGARGGLPAAPPHAGTAWLAAPTLLVTNHHVVNARARANGGRPLASPEDLALQAAAATATFDYDGDEGSGTKVSCSALVAWDPALDYAILRIAEDPARASLPVATQPLTIGPNDYVAVNVVQHPSGGVKRVALRNNLVHRATDRDLHYFTDTKGGSSGSPVCTDDWVAVALHRGSRHVENVRFQGKSTAYVNVGTQMAAILDDLRRRFPEVHAELGGSQNI